MSTDRIVFLLDVDNTLLDNDVITQHLRDRLDSEFGPAVRERYTAILQQVSDERGYRDYLGALQRYRVEQQHDVQLLSMSSWFVDYPFKDRLYPGALALIEQLRQWGTAVIVSDGDAVFQPRKIERSGLAQAVGGAVLIYIHKEEETDEIERRYPAEHYVVVDDKLRLLDAFKERWGERVTTVFVRQGHYAHDIVDVGRYPPADLTVEHIGDLIHVPLSELRAPRPRRATSTTVGYDLPLYILPFDHRASFVRDMFGWSGRLTTEQIATVAAAKQVIYDGFKAAVAAGVPRGRAGILVDEQFGAAVLRNAVREGFITALCVEASGQDEFDFAYGDDFPRHIDAMNPTFAKVLVRYNPAGDAAMNGRQLDRLRRLSEFLHDGDRRFMFELLVPPEPAQLASVGGDVSAFERTLRPALVAAAIAELQDAGVEPDVWKLEGLSDRADCERVVAVARRDGRTHVGCVILGHGSDEAEVLAWLRLAATVPGFTGFAVGRTTWLRPIEAWRAGEITRDEAVARIASGYEEWVSVFDPLYVS